MRKSHARDTSFHGLKLGDGMPHTSSTLNEYVDKTARRGPNPDEVAAYIERARQDRFRSRQAADAAQGEK